MARASFLLFLLLSAPLGLHHQVTDPGIHRGWKLFQAFLTFAVFFPSLLTFFNVVASLETGGRARGGKGWFAWFGRLPWGDPSRAPARPATGHPRAAGRTRRASPFPRAPGRRLQRGDHVEEREQAREEHREGEERVEELPALVDAGVRYWWWRPSGVERSRNRMKEVRAIGSLKSLPPAWRGTSVYQET